MREREPARRQICILSVFDFLRMEVARKKTFFFLAHTYCFLSPLRQNVDFVICFPNAVLYCAVIIEFLCLLWAIACLGVRDTPPVRH